MPSTELLLSSLTATQRGLMGNYCISLFFMSSLSSMCYPSCLRLCKDRKLGRGGTWSQSCSLGIQLAGSYKLHGEPNASEFIFKIAMMKFDRLSLSSSSCHCSLIRADLALPMGAEQELLLSRNGQPPLLPLQEIPDGTKAFIQQ